MTKQVSTKVGAKGTVDGAAAEDRRWWSVLVAAEDEPAGDDGQPRLRPDQDAVERLLDALWAHSAGTICTGLTGWSARIAVEADTVDVALTGALRIVRQAARDAGMPAMTVTEVEATRWDVFARGLGRMPGL